ncbi:LutC/YkgG family protein [Rugosimonospora africana]|uniref:Lactate utilization protein C n=1 Tax=Rugosimonospora africana TaxID=556532 RepID=A0A8J3VW63_9ACTN|nr:LUD domain-containing protein [Rugosimonospora africana]GIH20413.1 lactate utilization protein C [Rugosimonospora africana]
MTQASDAKTEILSRIRAALGPAPAPVAVPRDYRRALPEGTDLVELFAERAADYRATITRVPVADLPGEIARAADGRTLAVPADLPAEWVAGLTTVTDDPPLANDQLESTDGVLTGVATAIALTGTIILDTGPTQGRRALTLLPDYHLCVVRTDQIVGTPVEALPRLDPRRPQTWISGPSATSDIELNRVEGVHGPRTLHIIVAG